MSITNDYVDPNACYYADPNSCYYVACVYRTMLEPPIYLQSLRTEDAIRKWIRDVFDVHDEAIVADIYKVYDNWVEKPAERFDMVYRENLQKKHSGPTVEILSCTEDPVRVVSLAAGCCYGKSDVSEKRVKTCMTSGHLSVFEHVSATFKLSDISRACSHQLVRHRLASYSQQSQRYCKIDTSTDDWYVIPPDIDSSSESTYRDYMWATACRYNDLLKNRGYSPEDARFVLPEATKTEIVVTMNFREFMHFLDLRLSKKAQWEIRRLAEVMLEELRKKPGFDVLLEAGGY